MQEHHPPLPGPESATPESRAADRRARAAARKARAEVLQGTVAPLTARPRWR